MKTESIIYLTTILVSIMLCLVLLSNANDTLGVYESELRVELMIEPLVLLREGIITPEEYNKIFRQVTEDVKNIKQTNTKGGMRDKYLVCNDLVRKYIDYYVNQRNIKQIK
jgi:hypothetical protein